MPLRDLPPCLTSTCLPCRADQEYQAPPFYQGELGYNPGFDPDDPEKAGMIGPDGEELPGELRFVRKYKAGAQDQHPGHPGACFASKHKHVVAAVPPTIPLPSRRLMHACACKRFLGVANRMSEFVIARPLHV